MRAKIAYLSLGSNLGDRQAHLEQALEKLKRDQIRTLARSSIYETEPRDFPGQGWFLNMAVSCETCYFPIQLLGVLQSIERELGRVRGAGTVHKGPRIIDLDLLQFGNTIMNTPQLILPHPRMLERRFVLEPLLEIAPELKHAETKQPLSAYLSKVSAQKVRKLVQASVTAPA